MPRPDLLVVGAGPVGCTVAERAATQLNWSVAVVDRRSHIAGNCFDEAADNGILVHRYGPHYFRTNRDHVFSYLSQFTGWIEGNYIVKGLHKGELFPLPINLITLAQFFGRPFDAGTAAAYLKEIREDIPDPVNSEEFVLSRVGRELYEAFYLGYTLKQWGRHPRELAPSVCGRVLVRFNDDCRYVDHRIQKMPLDGFSAMFGRMLASPGISVHLGVDYPAGCGALAPRRATVYCGPVDTYFGNCLGPLPWRSLRFRFEPHDDRMFVQPCVQINYPDEHDYTRTVEIKHVTGQKQPGTVLAYEYPSATGEPFYPVPSRESDRLYRQYEAMAAKETRERRVFFAGRLAQYRYMDTDEAIDIGLETFRQLQSMPS